MLHIHPILICLYEKYQHLRLELVDLILPIEHQEMVLYFVQHQFYDHLVQNSDIVLFLSLVMREEVIELVY